MRQRGSAEAGGDVVTESLSDAGSLAAATAEVRAVFAYTIPPLEAGLEAEVSQGRSSVAAATLARIPHPASRVSCSVRWLEPTTPAECPTSRAGH